MKLVTVIAVAGAAIAAPLIAAAPASALPPGSCDGAACVPGVPKNAVAGASCVQGTRYAFGLDSSGQTFICSSRSQWVQTKPLIGIRPLGSGCSADEKGKKSAQSPDGIPMGCTGTNWIGDYSDIFYSPTYQG